MRKRIQIGNLVFAPPKAPTLFAPIVLDSNTILITISPSQNDGAGIATYIYERSLDGLTGWAVVANTLATNVTDIGLDPGTTYFYRVHAVDNRGSVSPFSSIQAGTTPSSGDSQPPSTPTGLTATVFSTTQIDLAWNASTDDVGVVQYRLQSSTDNVNFSDVTTVAGLTYSNTGLLTATRYYYRVRAEDAASNASGWSAVANAQTATTGDPFPRGGMVSVGTQNFEVAAYQTMASKRQVVLINFFNGWTHGTSPKAVCDNIKALSPYVNKTQIFNYTVFDIMRISDITDTTASNHAQALKFDTENWFLYASGITGTPKLSAFGTPNFNQVNVSTFPLVDASGKHHYQYIADLFKQHFITGDAQNAANSTLDGFFNDSIWAQVPVSGDYNLDGVSEGSTPTSDAWFRAGNAAYADYQRSINPTKKIIANGAQWAHITSGAVIPEYNQKWHGMLAESFAGETNNKENVFSTAQNMPQLQKMVDYCLAPKYVLFGHNSLNLDIGQDSVSTANGDPNWQAARAMNGMSQMKNMYYCPNQKDYGSGTQFDVDEWDGAGRLARGWLGQPLATVRGAEQTTAWSNGVWRRDFDNGIILWVPKDIVTIPATVNLGGTFYRLTGTQAPSVNNGAAVTSVTFNRRRDALFLSRTPT